MLPLGDESDIPQLEFPDNSIHDIKIVVVEEGSGSSIVIGQNQKSIIVRFGKYALMMMVLGFVAQKLFPHVKKMWRDPPLFSKFLRRN